MTCVTVDSDANQFSHFFSSSRDGFSNTQSCGKWAAGGLWNHDPGTAGLSLSTQCGGRTGLEEKH